MARFLLFEIHIAERPDQAGKYPHDERLVEDFSETGGCFPAAKFQIVENTLTASAWSKTSARQGVFFRPQDI